MFRETRYLYQRLSVLADLAVCVAAFYAAHFARNYVVVPLSHGMFRPSDLVYYRPLLFLFPPLALLFWAANGAYRVERLFHRWRMLKAVAAGAVEAVGVLLALRFFFGDVKSDPYTGALIRDSRGQIVLFPLVATALVWGRIEAARWWLAYRRSRGLAANNVLLVGSGENLRRFIAEVMSHPLWGFRIEGLVADHPDLRVGDRIQGHPVVAALAGLAPFLEAHAVDEVIFVPGRIPLDDLEPALRECETMGVRTRLSLNFFSRQIHRTALDTFEEIPVVTYNTIQEVNGAVVIKWVLDRLIAAAGLVALSPVMAAIAIAIRREGRPGGPEAPILFRQRRIGQNGRAFTLYKFRSMRPGAEQELEALRAQSDVDGPRFKMANDPRVTPVGRTLRKYSLDELPQLWNVLKGDMSLIGPRPPLAEEVARYTRAQRRRLSMKPGLTCLWAVRGRDSLDWESWMRADLEYIDTWSLWLDFKIMAKTLIAVARGKGAS